MRNDSKRSLDDLPDDPAALKVIIRQRDDEIARKQHFIDVLVKMVYGPRSEKLATWPSSDDPQKLLPFAEFKELERSVTQATQELAQQEQAPAPAPTRKHHGRRSTFPEHLPRFRSQHTLTDDERRCACGDLMQPMGEEVTQELERITATFVHEIARTKYSCRKCQDGVRIAPLPHRILDRSILGPGMLASTIVDRFLFHLPYHRLEKKHESEGLALSRVTLCQAAGKCAELLEPVYRELKRELLTHDILQSDATEVVVREGKAAGRHKGTMWIFKDLEGRHVYEFRPDGSGDGPREFLAGFKGYLQVDAGAAFNKVLAHKDVTEVGCWAHARRKFVEAKTTDPTLAEEILLHIKALYAVERQAKESALAPPQRRALRMEHSAPRLTEIHDWLVLNQTRVLPQSPMGQAIQYALNEWPQLKRYLEDGRLPIDNNGSENALRPVVLGRKNWLFMGTQEGGERNAVLYSLVRTCKEIGVNPFLYLVDVLLDISHCPAKEIGRLTPHGWKAWSAQRIARGEPAKVAGASRAVIEEAVADAVRKALGN